MKGDFQMYQIKENQLITEQGIVQFPHSIYSAMEIKGVIVVILACWSEPDDLDNMYGVKDGKIIWRVQPQLEFKPYIWSGPFTPLGESKANPYSDIDIYKKDPSLIIAVDACGFRYLIDPATGKIVGEESWVK